MPVLIHIVVFLVILGVILWLIELFPIDAAIKMIIRVIVIIAIVLWLLQVLLGIWPGLPPLRTP